jgi:hypothetical protein
MRDRLEQVCCRTSSSVRSAHAKDDEVGAKSDGNLHDFLRLRTVLDPALRLALKLGSRRNETLEPAQRRFLVLLGMHQFTGLGFAGNIERRQVRQMLLR